jgi:hypothetical protein
MGKLRRAANAIAPGENSANRVLEVNAKIGSRLLLTKLSVAHFATIEDRTARLSIVNLAEKIAAAVSRPKRRR